MEQLYSIDEVAKILGVGYEMTYRMVSQCRTCGKNYSKCKCKEFNPRIKAKKINESNQKIVWRIPLSLVEKEISKVK